MGKQVECADIGLECDFVAWAESEDELLELVRAHARGAHDMAELTPELEAEVRAAIRDV